MLLVLLLFLLDQLNLANRFVQAPRGPLGDRIFLDFLLILADLYFLLYLEVQAYRQAPQILDFLGVPEVPVLPSYL